MDLISIIALFSGTMGLAIGIGTARAYTKLVCHLREKNLIDQDFRDGLNWKAGECTVKKNHNAK